MGDLLEIMANGLLEVLPSTSVCGQKRRYQIAAAAIAAMPKLSAESRATIRQALHDAVDAVTEEYRYKRPEYRAKYEAEDKAPILAAIDELERLP